MILIKETQNDTLQGVIDGVNTVYTTSYIYIAGTISVYVNGRLKVKDWDDGFIETPPQSVTLKEPLLVGDSLEVEYQLEGKHGGGAEGGCPIPPRLIINRPGIQSDELVPVMLQPEIEV